MAWLPAEKIRVHLAARGAPEGILLIHRTGEHSSNRILQEGFQTNIEKYGMLASVATLHSEIDADFEQALRTTHWNSTHHVVVLVPHHALDALHARLAEHGVIVRSKAPDVLADAMGGTIPKEWVVGVFHKPSEVFHPNPAFNPAHPPVFSHLERALTPFKPRVGPRNRP